MKKKSIYKTPFRLLIIAMILVYAGYGCKKLVEVSPPVNSLNSGNVYSANGTAIAVFNGVYASLMNRSIVLNGSVLPGLSADELSIYSTTLTTIPNIAYYTNALTNNNDGLNDFWTYYYTQLFTINSAIEGLTGSTSLTPAVKQQLLGEAYFLRAYFYFYLVNYYGPVPLALSSDYKVNQSLSRSPVIQVYTQVVTDLKNAQNLLSNQYLDATLLHTATDRARPTKWAATALLARTYLYAAAVDNANAANDYANAASQASTLISNSNFSLSPLQNVFLQASSGNKETIWEMQPVITGQNTPDAWLFIIPSTGFSSTHDFYINPQLIGSFEPGDQRTTNWLNSYTLSGKIYYYPYKYKSATLNASVTEYDVIFRLAEQYLIRAEAEANGAPGNAVTDLNAVRNRAGLPNYAGATDKASLQTAILHERQVEFFTEQGQRWLDLKRTQTVNTVMSIVAPQKGGSWQSYQQFYPVPVTELQADPNLIQNSGY